jgi:hypothetical protein
MNAETLQALKGSIDKWYKIADGTGVDEGVNNCPLCEKFEGSRCTRCPVYKKTGKGYCRGTPYRLWARHQEQHQEQHIAFYTAPYKVKCPECANLATMEIKFLESLLPKEIKQKGKA